MHMFQFRSCKDVIFCGLEKELQGKVSSTGNSNGLFDLPQLTIDGMPASVDEMTQVVNTFQNGP